MSPYTSSNGVGVLHIFTSCRHCGVKCSVAWHIVSSTWLKSAFGDMNMVVWGVWYNSCQAVGGRIGYGTGGGRIVLLFLVARWCTYWVACTTLGEVKLVAVVALPAPRCWSRGYNLVSHPRRSAQSHPLLWTISDNGGEISDCCCMPTLFSCCAGCSFPQGFYQLFCSDYFFILL